MKASAGYRYPLQKSVLILGSAVLLLFLLLAAWKWSHKDGVPLVATTAEPFSRHAIHNSPAAEPRLTFATPYRNTGQEVKYVGDDACSICHQRISETYHRHPMG